MPFSRQATTRAARSRATGQNPELLWRWVYPLLTVQVPPRDRAFRRGHTCGEAPSAALDLLVAMKRAPLGSIDVNSVLIGTWFLSAHALVNSSRAIRADRRMHRITLLRVSCAERGPQGTDSQEACARVREGDRARPACGRQQGP